VREGVRATSVQAFSRHSMCEGLIPAPLLQPAVEVGDKVWESVVRRLEARPAVGRSQWPPATPLPEAPRRAGPQRAML